MTPREGAMGAGEPHARVATTRGPNLSVPNLPRMSNPYQRAEHATIEFMRRYSLLMLRLALGVVFLWFGALKLLDASPVADLVAKALPILPPRAAVLTSGTTECLIGLGLLTGRAVRITLLLFFALLFGTFLPLVTEPSEAFQNGNPLWLSTTGEFLLKNFVLIAAGFTIVGAIPKPGKESDPQAGRATEGVTPAPRVSPD